MGYLNVIFPSQMSAQSASLSLPKGAKVAKVEVQIDSGEPKSFDVSESPFGVEGTAFVPGSYSSKISGTVTNSLNQKIETVEVVAVAYNDKDEIIGGGFTYVDFVPASGKVAVSVNVNVTGKPAKVELYPQLTSLSKIGE